MADQHPDIVYGIKAICKIIGEPNERRTMHRLASGYIPGAWKAGRTWALTVPAFRRAVGLDAGEPRGDGESAGSQPKSE